MSAIREHTRSFPPSAHRIPAPPLGDDRYEIGYVSSPGELERVFRLRYQVFNVELDEGLSVSHRSGMDRDQFDDQCHHLVVRERSSGIPIGTYRLQTMDMANKGHGFYSSTIFELEELPESVRRDSLEIGRACIAREHRSLRVLYLLWKGLGRYVAFNEVHYIFGCCSLTGQDPAMGHGVFDRLKRRGNLADDLFVNPLPSHRLPDAAASTDADIPRLMRAYLTLGAKICSAPALDREFGTIDFLALFDLAHMDARRLAFYRCTS